MKNCLLEEFNTILHQEIAAMHSELQSLCQQASTDKLPDPKTVLNSIVKSKLANLHTEFKTTTMDQVHESIMLLHKQIQVYRQTATAIQKSPKRK